MDSLHKILSRIDGENLGTPEEVIGKSTIVSGTLLASSTASKAFEAFRLVHLDSFEVLRS